MANELRGFDLSEDDTPETRLKRKFGRHRYRGRSQAAEGKPQ